ncbi:MAG: anti-sigma factor [Bacteroidetes bacterium]|nr:anti-sigma factor [Bacteroidota bacterium]
MKHPPHPHTLTYKYLMVACIASLVISTFASYFFYDRWSEAEDRSVSLVSEMNNMTRKYNLEKNTFEKTFNDLLVLRDENAKVITLTATDSTRRYIARVYWNHYTRETYIDVLSLPSPDSTMQYQLWAFNGNEPVDAGVFRVNGDEGVQRIKPVAAADEWAVTLEPKGGSPVPTPDRFCLKTRK